MKLIDLIDYFRNNGELEDFLIEKGLDLESEVVEIYMKECIHIESDLAFFEIEKTEGDIEYPCNGVTYYNFIDFSNFLEVVDGFCSEQYKLYSSRKIAIQIFDIFTKNT